MNLNEEKLILVIFSIIVLGGVAVFSAFFPEIEAVFPPLCGGITGLVAIYCGANVGSQWVVNKTGVPPEEPVKPPT